ncbi:hypothetical protein [Streptomyces sp. NBC_01477]|uniref:hypothetical protein n=1 Tax=Streptomyces sp. NBC_01477 TaxID=2976015 RepID=UPI002E35E342|nr:hypothetical protein [Streptomyces sp. NBC_01477]
MPPPGQIPGRPPTGGGYGAPVPPQHNPYAQTSAGAPAGPYGPPQPSYYGPPQQPGAPGAAPGGRGGAGKAVLWAVVGAAVASALWGGGVVLLGKDSDKADLRGYTVKKNLCDTADLSAFTSEYPKPDDDPSSYVSDRPTVAEMYCSESLKKDASTYSDAYVTLQADLHRKSDPQPEFADRWRSYTDHGTISSEKYTVTAVDGFGDEAFLITQDTITTSSGSESGSREVMLEVRDGWMTFSLSWDAYASSLNDDSGATATISQATQWVKDATKATLPELK